MVIKPSELEQKATEHNKVAFETSVTELEAKIDEHMFFHVDRIRHEKWTTYTIPPSVPNDVVAEVVRRYLAADWNVTQYPNHYHSGQTLVFTPKPSEPQG